MFAKIRLRLHSTVHVSGVEKYLPLRSADFFRFADSFRFAALSPSVASLCHPWFTTTNLSYRFPIFEITTCRTTSERRSKRRQKITRKALCPHACGTTMPRWARSEKWKWLPQHTGKKKIETPTHRYTHIQFDLVWKRLLLMLNTT